VPRFPAPSPARPCARVALWRGDGGGGASVRCVTWNIAAINNNPFEYYITVENEPGYEELMLAVQELVDTPGERDMAVARVFTPDMFARLRGAMEAEGWAGVESVERIWTEDFSKRSIISGFLKDKGIGSKRLASMPDRFTNTINAADGRIICRPSVINNYGVEMRDLQSWFEQWFHFMFQSEVCVKSKQGVESRRVCTLLQPIKRSKYPTVTQEEEAISIPLQVLALAVFDAILVHVMNVCAPSSLNWHVLKMKLCNALVVNKQTNVLRLLAEQPAYGHADIVFMQEVAGDFLEAFKAHAVLSKRFALLVPSAVDFVRNQNSLILVARSRLVDGGQELDVSSFLPADVPIAEGDLCAYAVPLRLGDVQRSVVLASFHGDTAGLASTPVVSAVRRVASAAGLPVIFGLDANTHQRREPSGGTKHVDEFLSELGSGEEPLCHSWPGEETSRWQTTFNARTFLQPQLNKAVRYEERATSKLSDCNPKDFILFSSACFEVEAYCVKDNTGRLEYIEGMDFPTLSFPSDHAIVNSTLRLRSTL